MSFRRRLMVLVFAALLGTGFSLAESSPASAAHYCGTEVCYPDLCPNIKQKPYSIFC